MTSVLDIIGGSEQPAHSFLDHLEYEWTDALGTNTQTK